MLETPRFPQVPDASGNLQVKGAAEAPPVASLAQVTPELPDLLLVERIRNRDARAFETLMKRYNRRLYRIARSIVTDAAVAEECVRAAYLRACESLDRYEPAGKFGAWLTRLAFSEALGLRRSPAAVPGMSGDAVGSESSVSLEEAIDRLPVVFRTVFVLRVVEGMSGVEVAACLGLNETTVRTRLHRAQQRLTAERVSQMRSEPSTIFQLSAESGARIIAAVSGKLRWV